MGCLGWYIWVFSTQIYWSLDKSKKYFTLKPKKPKTKNQKPKTKNHNPKNQRPKTNIKTLLQKKK